MKYIKTNQSSQMITITGVKLISYTVIKDNQEPVRLKLHIGDIVDLNEESEGNELFRSITCGLYNIGDDCFWIIGRVGLQALKYGNKFTLQGNSHVSNCCHKDSYFVFGVWTRRTLDFFRRIGFQILTAASIFFTQDLESSFFVSLMY
ncbi:unnamed protein product [Rhizophagus irregularis]|nr:unnamed protein product [Rhizophagus irregularis]